MLQEKGITILLVVILLNQSESLTISKNSRQGRTLGVPCTKDADCDKDVNNDPLSPTNNEECAKTGDLKGLCQCKAATHIEDPKNTGKCILKPPSLRETCTVNDASAKPPTTDNCATDFGQACPKDKKCKCNGPFKDNPKNPKAPAAITTSNEDACLPLRGAPCSKEKSCKADCLQCNAGGKCICADKFKPTSDGMCGPTEGGACQATDNADTLCVEACPFVGMECNNGFCKCKANQILFEEKDKDDKCVCTIGCACDVKRDVCVLDKQKCKKADGTDASADAQPAGTQTCQCEDGTVEDKDKDGNPVCKAGQGSACPVEDKAKPSVPFGDAACLTGMMCYAETVSGNKKPNFDDRMPKGAGICSCPKGEETGQDKKCVKSLGTACTASDKCADNAECSMGKCKCKAEFVDDNGDDTAAGKCSAKIGAGCPKGSECSLTNLVCFSSVTNAKTDAAEPKDKPGTQKCQCEAKFGPNADNNKCVESVGAECPKNDECTLENQDCIVKATKKPAENTKDKPAAAGTQFCECKDKFGENAGSCVPTLGAVCNPEGNDCKMPMQGCNPDTKTCVESFGAKCPADGKCKMPNQECKAGKCACEKGFNDKDGLCTEWESNFCAAANANCGKDDGDCNDDSQCAGDLTCGINNCGKARPLADCCVDPKDPTGNGVGTPCDGSAPNVWGCCTPESPCGEKQGDCDSDKDCKKVCETGNDCKDEEKIQLKCMPDSCGTAGKFANIFPLGQMDCCQKPTTAAGFYNNIDFYQLYEYWKNDDEQDGQRPKY